MFLHCHRLFLCEQSRFCRTRGLNTFQTHACSIFLIALELFHLSKFYLDEKTPLLKSALLILTVGLCLNIFCVGQAARGSAKNMSQQKGSVAQKVWEPLFYIYIVPWTQLPLHFAHSIAVIYFLRWYYLHPTTNQGRHFSFFRWESHKFQIPPKISISSVDFPEKVKNLS